MPLALPLVSDLPQYTANQEQLKTDIWELTRSRFAEEIFPISWPSKMDCPAWGISAERCKVGSRLRKVIGSTCEGCYAMRGTFRSPNVVKKLEQAHAGIRHPKWVPAGVAMVRWYAKERFRWFHSGDLDGVIHLRNIIRVCLETPDVLHWLPTREAETVKQCRDEIPDNLRVRLS